MAMTSQYSVTMLSSPHIPPVSSNSISPSSSSSSASSSDSSLPDTGDVIKQHPCLRSTLSSSPRSGRCLEHGKCVDSCAAYGHICPLAAVAAGRAARTKIDALVEDSQLFGGREPNFPTTIPPEHLILGEKLGEGGFCSVYSCAIKDTPLDESCAVKFLRPQIAVSTRNFEHGAADLATEALFLSQLEHANIIRLRAVSEGSVESNFMSGRETGFFLVLERLVETLEHRIHRWKVQMEEMPHSLFYRMSKECKDKQKALLNERLQVAVDIAVVMSYLHSLNLVYRDLKPDNLVSLCCAIESLNCVVPHLIPLHFLTSKILRDLTEKGL
jgi:hypothetical protein